jgi:hypothetical protein
VALEVAEVQPGALVHLGFSLPLPDLPWSEVAAGLVFLKNGGDAWAQYAQVLLGSSEFSAVN